MEKFIPIEKMSKKQKKEYYSRNRITWDNFDPTTRVVPSKKHYNRAKEKNLIYDYQ